MGSTARPTAKVQQPFQKCSMMNSLQCRPQKTFLSPKCSVLYMFMGLLKLNMTVDTEPSLSHLSVLTLSCFLGSYFARDASYSHRYATLKSKPNNIMFVALVLIGEYTRGSGSYVRPPPKGSGKDLYDSCVDSKSDPSIFVVFEKQQIYPEYIIDYS